VERQRVVIVLNKYEIATKVRLFFNEAPEIKNWLWEIVGNRVRRLKDRLANKEHVSEQGMELSSDISIQKLSSPQEKGFNMGDEVPLDMLGQSICTKFIRIEFRSVSYNFHCKG